MRLPLHGPLDTDDHARDEVVEGHALGASRRLVPEQTKHFHLRRRFAALAGLFAKIALSVSILGVVVLPTAVHATEPGRTRFSNFEPGRKK